MISSINVESALFSHLYVFLRYGKLVLNSTSLVVSSIKTTSHSRCPEIAGLSGHNSDSEQDFDACLMFFFSFEILSFMIFAFPCNFAPKCEIGFARGIIEFWSFV